MEDHSSRLGDHGRYHAQVFKMNQPFFYGCWPVATKTERSIELEYFKGGDTLLLECTQLGGKPSRQAKIVKQWCAFFSSKDVDLENLYVSTRIPVKLFEAICECHQLQQFGFKWGPIKDLSPIRSLSNLTHFGLGSSSVDDLSPIGELKSCVQLGIENADRTSDYSAIGELEDLEYLHIDGSPLSSNKKVEIDDLDFLANLKKLRGLSIGFARIRDQNWPNILANLPSLEELFVPTDTKSETRGMFLQCHDKLKLHNLDNA